MLFYRFKDQIRRLKERFFCSTNLTARIYLLRRISKMSEFKPHHLIQYIMLNLTSNCDAVKAQNHTAIFLVEWMVYAEGKSWCDFVQA